MWRPLHYACQSGNLLSVELLLSRRADIHALTKVVLGYVTM
jgi:ankyrin repeat protein